MTDFTGLTIPSTTLQKSAVYVYVPPPPPPPYAPPPSYVGSTSPTYTSTTVGSGWNTVGYATTSDGIIFTPTFGSPSGTYQVFYI